MVVSPRDEVVEQTLENGNDVGRDEYAAVKKTAEGFAEVSELLLGVVITLGLKNNTVKSEHSWHCNNARLT